MARAVNKEKSIRERTMDRHYGDMKAIEALHQQDIRAALEGNFRLLRSLVDDDAVLLPPGGPIRRGREELDAAFSEMQSTPRTHQVIEYQMSFEEVQILGNVAIEWGAILGAMRDLATGEISRSRYHVMRVLKRQRNGGWKVYRSIWAPSA